MNDKPKPNDPRSTARCLAAAKRHEGDRRWEEAVESYSAAGSWPEAARILVQLRRFDDAAAAFLRALPDQLTRVEDVSPRALKCAFQAGVCYARSGRIRHAVALFVNLGEFERAAEVLRRAGRREDAAQAARGRPLQDSPWPAGYLSSGQVESRPKTSREEPLARADRYIRAGRTDDALAVLLKIEANDPAYSEAVARAVRVAGSHGLMSPALDEFVAPFIDGGADNRHHAAHAPALYGLGRIYQRLNMGSSAVRAFQALVDVVPGYRDAALRLTELVPRGYRGEAPEPPPPSLPSLPSLPPVRSPGAAQREPARGPGPRLPTPRQEAREPRRGLSATRKIAHLTPHTSSASRRSPDQLNQTASERSQELGLGPVAPGTVIAERYLVEQALGEGGYAIVFQVRDLEIDESMALKLFNPREADQRAVERFRREMRIARKLVHPNVVAAFEFGSWRNAYYITMELLEGQDLHSFCEDVHWGTMPMDVALDLTSQALAGLGFAHDLGGVHRDVKLRNLFVLQGGERLKVMDFGIATATGAGTGLTRTGMVVGTPAFVAPERLQPKPPPPDPKVDTYAMGVVLYRLLTGVLPFDRRSVAALFSEILTREPRPPSQLNSEIPPDVEAIVQKLMAKDPADRFMNAATAMVAIATARERLARQS